MTTGWRRRRRPRWYVLEGKEVVLVRDVRLAMRRFGLDDRRVAYTVLPDGREVSTIFLGIDHSFGHGPPLLFETMVFTEAGAGNERRCSTWDEAEAQHAAVVKELTKV